MSSALTLGVSITRAPIISPINAMKQGLTKLASSIVLLGFLASYTAAEPDQDSAHTTSPPHPSGSSIFKWNPVEIKGKQYIPIDQIKTFYYLEETKREGKKISLESQRVNIDFTVGNQAAYINKVKFFLSYPIKVQDERVHISQLDLNTLLDPVLRPSFIKAARYPNTVILDAGHGGKDQGSAKLESTYTLAIIKKIQNQLSKKGYHVVLTRSEDINVPLEERLRIANREKHAVFISLHFNSGDKNVQGMETYIISARTPHPAGATSAALATAVHSRSLISLNHKQYGNNFQIQDRGIRHAKFRLLKDSKHPAILIEAGFLSNKDEAAKIASQDYQNTLAKSIVRGIDVYRVSLNKRKEPSTLRAQGRAASFGWPSD